MSSVCYCKDCNHATMTLGKELACMLAFLGSRGNNKKHIHIMQRLQGMRQGRTGGRCSGQVGPRLIRARPHSAPPPAETAPFSRL